MSEICFTESCGWWNAASQGWQEWASEGELKYPQNLCGIAVSKPERVLR